MCGEYYNCSDLMFQFKYAFDVIRCWFDSDLLTAQRPLLHIRHFMKLIICHCYCTCASFFHHVVDCFWVFVSDKMHSLYSSFAMLESLKQQRNKVMKLFHCNRVFITWPQFQTDTNADSLNHSWRPPPHSHWSLIVFTFDRFHFHMLETLSILSYPTPSVLFFGRDWRH